MTCVRSDACRDCSKHLSPAPLLLAAHCGCLFYHYFILKKNIQNILLGEKGSEKWPYQDVDFFFFFQMSWSVILVSSSAFPVADSECEPSRRLLVESFYSNIKQPLELFGFHWQELSSSTLNCTSNCTKNQSGLENGKLAGYFFNESKTQKKYYVSPMLHKSYKIYLQLNLVSL